jgi:hypothetical protein
MENQINLTEDQMMFIIAIDAQVSAMNEEEWQNLISEHPDRRSICIGNGLVYDPVQWGVYELS